MLRYSSFKLTLLLLVAISGAIQAKAVTVIGGPIVNPANGHRYYLLDYSTWTEAQAQAVTLGGNLATIRNASEQLWVFNTFSTFGGVNRDLWIGLNDSVQEGNFVWASGEPLTYTRWSPGNPDNSSGIEDYVHIIAPGLTPDAGPAGSWNDYPNQPASINGRNTNGVVEVVPEPQTLALMASGVCLLLTRRRK